ncbi:MAG: 30S ribosomal protein S16 [Saprospiraceae bacterium]
MPVKIRLQRKGRKQAPFYHIVIADARSPRDGRFIEKIGTYNPLTVPATIELNNEKAYQWLKNGAQPTDTVRSILRFKGVLYQKHLDRGVNKGAMTPEQATEKLESWIADKQTRVEARRDDSVKQKLEFKAKVDGTKKVKVKPAPPVEEAPVVEEETAPVAEETALMVEETAPVVAEETAPVAEETAAVVEETPPVVAEETAPVVAEEAAPIAEEPVAAKEEAPGEEVPAAEEEPAKQEPAAEVAEEGAPVSEEAPPEADAEKTDEA